MFCAKGEEAQQGWELGEVSVKERWESREAARPALSRESGRARAQPLTGRAWAQPLTGERRAWAQPLTRERGKGERAGCTAPAPQGKD